MITFVLELHSLWQLFRYAKFEITKPRKFMNWINLPNTNYRLIMLLSNCTIQCPQWSILTTAHHHLLRQALAGVRRWAYERGEKAHSRPTKPRTWSSESFAIYWWKWKLHLSFIQFAENTKRGNGRSLSSTFFQKMAIYSVPNWAILVAKCS